MSHEGSYSGIFSAALIVISALPDYDLTVLTRVIYRAMDTGSSGRVRPGRAAPARRWCSAGSLPRLVPVLWGALNAPALFH